MAVMGVGLGAMMQNLVLAVQNTVDVRDIGAASATVAFFRTLGGAVGVSVLGAVLATRVQDSTLEGLRHLEREGRRGRRPEPERGRPGPRRPAGAGAGPSCASRTATPPDGSS